MNKNYLTIDPDKLRHETTLLHVLSAFYILFYFTSLILLHNVVAIGGIHFNCSLLAYPVTYVILNIITEIYGSNRAKQIIYLAAACHFIFYIYTKIAIFLPFPNFWSLQSDYIHIFDSSFTLFIYTILSYFIGAYLNCFFLSQSKYLSKSILIRFLASAYLAIILTQSLINCFSPWYFSHSAILTTLLQILYLTAITPLATWLTQYINDRENFNSIDASKHSPKLFPIVGALFTFFFIAPKTLAAKFTTFFGFIVNVGSIGFVFSYIISDLLTEVYGYQRARRMIWISIICNFIYIGLIQLSIVLPPPEGFLKQHHQYKVILSNQLRLVIASCVSYLIGDFFNCFILAKLKVIQFDKRIVLRLISSTAIGVSIDVTLCIFIAFAGTIQLSKLIIFIISEIFLRISYASLMAPITAYISKQLKRKEKTNIYDFETNFSPFTLNIYYKNNCNLYQEKEL